MKLTKKEKDVLGVLNIVMPCLDPVYAVIDECKPEVESLMKKGIIKPYWDFDEELLDKIFPNRKFHHSRYNYDH